jgi:hypothetical protein
MLACFLLIFLKLFDMRIILLFTILCICILPGFSQTWDVGVGYANQTPLGSMVKKINAANTVNFTIGYRVPVLKNKVFVFADFGFGRYGKKSVEQTFQSDDVPTPTKMMINYSNYSNYAHLNLRYDLFNKGIVQPYVQATAGIHAMGTRVFTDEHGDDFDDDDCRPLLEDAITFKRRKAVVGYGAGLMVRLIKAYENDPAIMYGDLLLNFSVTRIGGGNISYVNVKELEEIDTNTNPNPTANAATKDLTMPFININTSNIHNHTVAKIYTSPLQQLQFKLGFIYRLQR